jgi:hypothetical protein
MEKIKRKKKLKKVGRCELGRVKERIEAKRWTPKAEK